MYMPGQIVWSVDKRKPVKIGDNVWNNKSYPKGKTTHFINSEGAVVTLKTINEANILLKQNRICPAPCSKQLCWSCDMRLSDAPRKECKATDEHHKCSECKGFRIYAKYLGKLVCEVCSNQLTKNGFLIVAKELLKEILLIHTQHDKHSNKVSELIEHLVELDDPGNIKRDGWLRDQFQEMMTLRYNKGNKR